MTTTSKEETMEIAEEARELSYDLPSFCKELFLGNFVPSLIYPFPKPDPKDQQEGDEFVAKFKELAEKLIDPDEIEVTREIPQEVLTAMADLGCFAIKIPKKYDGMGLSQYTFGRVLETIATHCGATTTLLSAHQSIGVPQPLKLYGTEQQKQKFFPRFRKGAISAFALTEPDVGSDPAQMKCKAELSDDGEHYILNGTKLWCTNGTIADLIIVTALTEPKVIHGKERKQISCFILEMNSPGVEILHRCEFMGLGGIYNGYIRFKDVKIPKDNLLGETGRGLKMALETINVGRLSLSAACSGAAKQALRIARRWSKERVQWGQPIGLHEEGAEKIAYIASHVMAMQAMSRMLSLFVDQKTADVRIEGSMAKLFTTESLWKITDLTMQLRGGRGYEKSTSLKARGEPGYPVERMMRDCRVNTILEGSTEIMHLFIAREAMDPHMKRAGDLIKRRLPLGQTLKIVAKLLFHYAWWYPSQLLKSFSFKRYSEMGPLAKHYRFVDRTSHRLARSIFFYMAKYQKGLESKQLLLGRLMEIGTELFAISATCSYALSRKEENAIELAEFFCRESRRRIRGHFRSLDDNDDKMMNKVTKKVLNDEFKWLEEGSIEL